ncbi:MAG: hypothetical protein K8F29_10990 [Kofleriaceae bacterium]|nr:hypothetical protein [Candidatus Methylomirabilis lanthanidiphila]
MAGGVVLTGFMSPRSNGAGACGAAGLAWSPQLLQVERNAGIHLTDNGAMVPASSVSMARLFPPRGDLLCGWKSRTKPGVRLCRAQANRSADGGALAVADSEL